MVFNHRTHNLSIVCSSIYNIYADNVIQIALLQIYVKVVF